MLRSWSAAQPFGSGLNYKKKGLQRLLELILFKRIRGLVALVDDDDLDVLNLAQGKDQF